jgi:hypothetical protein
MRSREAWQPSRDGWKATRIRVVFAVLAGVVNAPWIVARLPVTLRQPVLKHKRFQLVSSSGQQVANGLQIVRLAMRNRSGFGCRLYMLSAQLRGAKYKVRAPNCCLARATPSQRLSATNVLGQLGGYKPIAFTVDRLEKDRRS